MPRPKFLTQEELLSCMNESEGDFSGGSDEEYQPNEDDEEERLADESAGDFSGGSDEEYQPNEDEEVASSNSDSDDGEEAGDDEEADDNEETGDNEEAGDTVDPLFKSKDGTVWTSRPSNPQCGRMRAENVITLRPGVTRYAAARVDSIKDAFLLFFTPDMERRIIDSTNSFGKWKFPKEFIELNADLLHAYLAVLILSGVFRFVNNILQSLTC